MFIVVAASTGCSFMFTMGGVRASHSSRRLGPSVSFHFAVPAYATPQMLRCSTMDPGIAVRNTDPSAQEAEPSIDHDTGEPLKWCKTCFLYRATGMRHCRCVLALTCALPPTCTRNQAPVLPPNME